MVNGLRAQILGQLKASRVFRDQREVNTNSTNWAVVKAALTAGHYPNLARIDKEQGQIKTRTEPKVDLLFYKICKLYVLPP